MKKYLKGGLIGLLISFAVGATAFTAINLVTQVQGVLPVANGGTGTTSYAPYNQTAVAITGGTINGTTIGGTTAAAVTGTTVTANTQFTGPGTGLTGTAASLSIGGNAATATTSTNQSGGTVAATTVAASTSYSLNGKVLYSTGTPTIASGFLSSPSITPLQGTSAFIINVGATGATNVGSINMNATTTPPTGWACQFTPWNVTQIATNYIIMTSTTTTISLTQYNNAQAAFNFVGNGQILAHCWGY